MASQAPNIKILYIILLLFIRGIGFNKHSISNYALISIYILSIDAFGNAVKILIIKKAYLVNNLKALILISINIIGPKVINISVIKKVYIKNYKTFAPIKIKIRK